MQAPITTGGGVIIAAIIIAAAILYNGSLDRTAAACNVMRDALVPDTSHLGAVDHNVRSKLGTAIRDNARLYGVDAADCGISQSGSPQ